MIRHAAEFELKAESHGVDLQLLRERKRALIADSPVTGRAARGRALHPAPRAASLVDAHTVEVRPRDGLAAFQGPNPRSFHRDRFEVFVPPVPGLAETGF